MGLQLIGRPRGDRALLELTEAYDRATGWVRGIRPRPARVAAMPEIVLHALPPSHPCMTAEAALQLKGLDYERVDFVARRAHGEDGASSTATATRPCPAC